MRPSSGSCQEIQVKIGQSLFLETFSPDPEACEQRWYRYSFSNCQFESVMENILEECGCYPAWMLIHAGNAIKNYYADTRHAEAESCRGYEITCYKKILGKMSNYTTITSPEGEKLTCLPPCNDQLMAVGVLKTQHKQHKKILIS